MKNIDHRPWPPPKQPWVLAQSWHDALFAFWPMPVSTLRPFIPSAFQIDTFEGQTWLGIVSYRMNHVRLRGIPALPWISAFPELYVRTCVTMDNKPGTFFLSVDASDAFGVAIARKWFHLPNYQAKMSLRMEKDRVHFSSQRFNPEDPPAVFIGSYKPTGDPMIPQRGSLAYWLMERYCFYMVDSGQKLYRTEMHHAPWPLQPAEATFDMNTMITPFGIRFPETAPTLYFVKQQNIMVWWPREVGAKA